MRYSPSSFSAPPAWRKWYKIKQLCDGMSPIHNFYSSYQSRQPPTTTATTATTIDMSGFSNVPIQPFVRISRHLREAWLTRAGIATFDRSYASLDWWWSDERRHRRA